MNNKLQNKKTDWFVVGNCHWNRGDGRSRYLLHLRYCHQRIAVNLVYVSFIIGGGIAYSLSAYSYAKLGSKYPSAGGPVEFLIRGFGDGILSGGFNFLFCILVTLLP